MEEAALSFVDHMPPKVWGTQRDLAFRDMYQTLVFWEDYKINNLPFLNSFVQFARIQIFKFLCHTFDHSNCY